MLKLAIELGTSVTKIYGVGSGIVLAESTCLAVSRESGEVRAYGNEAKRLHGKTAEDTAMVFPVCGGEIVDEPHAGALLEYFLGKVVRRAFRVEALFCVPCGTSIQSREKYYRVAKSAGISRVEFAETPFLVALGQDVALSESNPVFAIDIGAGKTSTAVFSLDGIIAGLTMDVGGNRMDTLIIDHIAGLYHLKIGPQTSEKLKNTVGSLLEYDNQSMIVNGRDVVTGKPRAVTVSSGDIFYPISKYVDKVIEYAELLLRKVPAEVSAAMCKNGVYLAGGVAAVSGFGEYVANKLQMEAHLAEDVHTAVVLGGGRVVGSNALMRKICLK